MHFVHIILILYFLTWKSATGMRDKDRKSQAWYYVGDMLFPREDFVEYNNRAGMEGYSNGKYSQISFKWPNNTIFYEFDPSISNNKAHMERIMLAMKDLESVVPNCLHFVPKSDTTKHWVLIDADEPGKRCSAAVGYRGNMGTKYTPQLMQLKPSCTFGSIVHELLHAIGYFHEQTRDDRDKYVNINFSNIKKGHLHNFYKNGEEILDEFGKARKPAYKTSYYEVKYNYNSIMHYSALAFAKHKTTPTIVSLNHHEALGKAMSMGQRDHFSLGDILMIAKRHGCQVPERQSMPLSHSEPPTDEMEDSDDEYNEGSDEEEGNISEEVEVSSQHYEQSQQTPVETNILLDVLFRQKYSK